MPIKKASVIKAIVIVILILIFSIPVLYAFFVYTPTVNVQCGICHTMSFYIGNISKPHSKYSCLVCHKITIGDMDACAGEETAVEFLNATFIVVTRGGVVKDVYYLDIAEAAKRAGQSLVFTPEWRALAFNVKTRVVDLCNWLQIDLAGKYGGDIGLLKIVS